MEYTWYVSPTISCDTVLLWMIIYIV
jgi:hypothetical protein